MSSQNGSSLEEFRGVIDDLTVENKKLKRKLKRFEKLQDAHLQDEKLFEVRVHGLPAEKKRELEEALKQFALSLNDSPVSESPRPRLDRYVPGLISHKTATSSHTSNQQPADSAYASMSASGQGSSLPGHSSTGANGRDRPFKGMAKSPKSRDHNIQSYLLDIPEGLLPRRPPVMTERTKSKLVVRRLEQIFAGKGATDEGHQQPLQQQEVSQMAAKADRSEIEARGQRAGIEGLREARIMPEEIEDPMFLPRNKEQPHLDPRSKRQLNRRDTQDTLNEITPEQRPTRPLDLDPHRAQVPVENMNYIRHLGFSPPDMKTMAVFDEGHGWIYLNLLINMAQLHTLNVTSDFVRKALADFSSKLELSNDGRRVRWQGGPGISKTSSDGSSSADLDPEGYYRSRQENRRKRRSKGRKAENRSTIQPSPDDQQKSLNTGGSINQVSYTPLFFHRETSDGEIESSHEESGLDESPQPAYVTGNSSGLASSGMRTSSSRKRRDDGPIIFYNKARFCTDLSGDRGAGKERLRNMIDYQSVTPNIIGHDDRTRQDRQSTESTKGPLSRGVQLPEPMDLDDNPIPIEQELIFPNDSPVESSRSQSRKSSPEPLDFEVSGLGGVCPDDNFEITVKNRHMPREAKSRNPQAAHGFGKKVHHHRFAAILGSMKGNSFPAVDEQIVGVKKRNLPPSALPPPSYFLTESSPETDESDADSDASQDPGTPDREVPATAPQPLAIPTASSDEDSSEDSDLEDDEDDSDASVDFLAAAREIDPETVQAQEREYDSNVAERIAEEIPTGSSAATAGGGSGFASPASNIANTGEHSDDEGDDGNSGDGMEEPKSIRDQGQKGPAGLKRSRTSDSMVVYGKAPRLV